MDTKTKEENKTRVFLEKKTVNQLIQLKRVGDSYDSVIQRLLEEKKHFGNR